MGALVEGQIPQFFHGVSRQPHNVRYTGQVQDAENVEFSVETGGFSKRLGTRIKKKLSGFSTGSNRKLHIINRDANERYRVVLSSGSLRVFDETYTEKTVTLGTGVATWLTSSPDNFNMVSVLDYTFIVKKTDTAAMSATVAAAAPSMAVFYVAAIPEVTAAVHYIIKVNGTTKADYTSSITDTTTNIADGLTSLLVTNLGAGWTVSASGSYVFVKKNDGTAFTVSTTSPRGDTALVSYKGPIKDASLAPARALEGMMLQVKGVTGTSYWIVFEAADGTSGEGYWREALTPGAHTGFDATTMPRALVRNPDGTFTLDVINWTAKTVGDDTTVPNPEFIGQTIRDVVFLRNRLGMVAGETVYWSRNGDYFNFWPTSAFELNEDDPFGLTNTTNAVSRFFFAVPFRRSTFIMGDNAQFEIGGTSLSPSAGSIDLATSYAASPYCRPRAVGDELYFPAEVGGVSSLLSYVYDEATVSETANDISKHVEGYIPSPIVELAGDPVRGLIAALSTSAPDRLFMHKFYYQGTDRVQSAWYSTVMAGSTIRSIGIVDGVLNVLADWNGAVWLLELPTVEDLYSDYDWTPRLDYHQFLTGTYDAGTDTTTWALGYTPTDPVAISSNKFPSGKRMLSVALTISTTNVVASGDWSAYPMLIGENFNCFVELSKVYYRPQNDVAVSTGRLQLRTMQLDYTDTGYFTVTVTPYNRDPREWVFTGRVLGSAANQVQKFALLSGAFRFSVRTKADEAVIRIGSDKFMPVTITSAVWTGFYNEITRQG